MNRRLLGGIGTVAATGAVALFLAVGSRDTAGADTARVERGDLQIQVEATGKLEAAVAFEIGPPSIRNFWNYNLEWMIPEGTAVAQGDVIARFDATQIDDRLRDRRAQLEKTLQRREKEERNLEVELRQLHLDLVKAEGELKTVDLDLEVPSELVSFIELEQTRLKQQLAHQRVAFLRDKIELEQELVQSKLELLDVKLASTEGKIKYNETAKEKFSVHAPVDGMVIYVPKHNGDRWEVGENVWMLAKILKVADVGTLRVKANVLEIDAAKIGPGQPADIAVDAIPGLVLHSRVTEIGQIVHERSRQDSSKVFDAILPLDKAGPDDTATLRPGMGVRVTIETARLEDCLTIPLGAVRSTPVGTFVDVRSGRGTERRAVVLGQRNRERIVVESGLAEGDTVLLTGAAG